MQGRDGREAYTRAGDLRIDPNGQLLTGTGLPVLGDGGPISVPPNTSLAIAPDGTISIVPLGQGPETTATVGRIKLVNPPKDQLDRGEDGLFRMRDGTELPADANVRVASGVLESSNVNVADAMVQHDRARAELRAAGEGHAHGRRQRAPPPLNCCAPPDRSLTSLQGTTEMNPALWAAKTGLDAQQTRMTVTSHNLANVATSGFKKGRAVFEDLLYQNVKQVGAATSQDTQSPSGLSLGTGVRVVATEKSYTQGNLLQTQQRAGRRDPGPRLLPDPDARRHHGLHARRRFQTNAQGELVTSSGYRVQPGINIPDSAQSVTIGADGVVSAQLPGQSAPTQVGTMQLADFVNPAGLEARGENLLFESASSGPAQTGTPGLNGLGQLAAGLARELERQRRGRAGEHDRNPARLRDELEGDRHDRPDAPVRHQQPVRPNGMTLTMPSSFATRRCRCAARAAAGGAARRASADRRRFPESPGRSRRRPPPSNGAIYQAGTRRRAVRERNGAPRRRHRHDPPRREHQRLEELEHDDDQEDLASSCPARPSPAGRSR